MNWDAICDFINSKDPAFLSTVRGVPPEVIRDVGKSYEVTLPHAYVEFLEIMGEASGNFPPILPSQASGFAELLDELPAQLPGGRYFKVSSASDPEEISPSDFFLDLERSDGEDAPLVMFADGEPFVARSVIDSGFTFGEYITMRVFGFFELFRRAHCAAVLVFDVPPDQAVERVTQCVELLSTLKFAQVLPRQPRVACLARDGLGALIAYKAELTLVSIELCEDDAALLKATVEQAHRGIPGSRVRATDGQLEAR
jgi:hypothetical protein